MRFLVDECVGPAVARWLREQGHEVFSVYEESRGMDDDAILHKSMTENRILLTADKDFGEKIYRERRPHCGVVLVRLSDQRAKSKITVVASLLQKYSDHLPSRYVVVTEERVRFAGQ